MASSDDAAAYCTGIGLNLCSAEQLFNVVFVSQVQPDLCFSGYMSSSYNGASVGWFTQNAGCDATGFGSWAPATPGAHCCGDDVEASTIETCASASCGVGYVVDDDASSSFCVGGSCTEEQCCKAWESAPAYVAVGSIWGDSYQNGDDANAACAANHEDLQLCTQDQLLALFEIHNQCSVGWFVTERDGDNANSAYARGHYVGFPDEGGCHSVAGWNPWVPAGAWDDATGTGSAHCCAASYRTEGYPTTEAYADPATACNRFDTANVDYGLCSGKQLETIANIEVPNQCLQAHFDGGNGWYQGDVTVQGCGNANGLNQYPDAAIWGIHCCASWVAEKELQDYGVVPAGGAYASGYANKADAQSACQDAGYAGLCSQGQQAYVEENQDDLGFSVACLVGHVSDDDVTPGFWANCGTADSWNDAWQPSSSGMGNPVGHCCQTTVPAKSLVQKAYFNGNWDYGYTTQDAAATMCTGDYSLCSGPQLQVIATTGVLLEDGSTQVEDNICRLGWTSGGEKGWYQGDGEAGCGSSGWQTFSSDGATYHCCLGFPAGSAAPTGTPSYPVFQQASTWYEFADEADALAACQFLNEDYVLCSDEEITLAATTESGVPSPGEGWDAVEQQKGLCYSGWTDSSRSVELVGWFGVEDSCGDGWQSWHPEGAAGGYCCFSAAFDAIRVAETDMPSKMPTEMDEPTKMPTEMEVTSAPTDMEVTSAPTDMEVTAAPTDMEVTAAPTDMEVTAAPTDMETTASTDMETTASPTMAPTAAGDTLPSNHASPADCVPIDHSIDGFPGVHFCELDGTVYLNGISTCTAAGDNSALDDLWRNNWGLAAEGCDNGKSEDEATQDQLWITNEMCNNLEEDINDLQGDVDGYIDNWTSSVVALVEENMGNFDEATQIALQAYLDQLTEA